MTTKKTKTFTPIKKGLITKNLNDKQKWITKNKPNMNEKHLFFKILLCCTRNSHWLCVATSGLIWRNRTLTSRLTNAEPENGRAHSFLAYVRWINEGPYVGGLQSCSDRSSLPPSGHFPVFGGELVSAQPGQRSGRSGLGHRPRFDPDLLLRLSPPHLGHLQLLRHPWNATTGLPHCLPTGS